MIGNTELKCFDTSSSQKYVLVSKSSVYKYRKLLNIRIEDGMNNTNSGLFLNKKTAINLMEYIKEAIEELTD